jgi:hypothetical protein
MLTSFSPESTGFRFHGVYGHLSVSTKVAERIADGFLESRSIAVDVRAQSKSSVYNTMLFSKRRFWAFHVAGVLCLSLLRKVKPILDIVCPETRVQLIYKHALHVKPLLRSLLLSFLHSTRLA